MKTSKIIAFNLCTIFLSCGAPTKIASLDTQSDYPSYIDQELSGLIGNKDWSLNAGRLTEPSEGSSEKRWNFTLVSSSSDDVCGEFMLNGEDKLSVIFSVPEEELKNGRIDLGFLSQSITLTDSASTPSENFVAVDGFMEFTEVETSHVSGKLVAHADDRNSVNGNFNITRCCRVDQSSFDYEVCK